MTHTHYTIGAIAILFIITCITRALPFIFGKKMQNNAFILFIGEQLPVSIILLLCVFTIIEMAQPTHWKVLPNLLIALFITLSIHWKWRNITISILFGSITYIVMNHYLLGSR